MKKDNNPGYDWSLKDICECVFEHYIKAKEDWFLTPTPYLPGGENPATAIKTHSGLRRVKQILLAVIYGVYL